MDHPLGILVLLGPWYERLFHQGVAPQWALDVGLLFLPEDTNPHEASLIGKEHGFLDVPGQGYPPVKVALHIHPARQEYVFFTPSLIPHPLAIERRIVP